MLSMCAAMPYTSKPHRWGATQIEQLQHQQTAFQAPQVGRNIAADLSGKARLLPSPTGGAQLEKKLQFLLYIKELAF